MIEYQKDAKLILSTWLSLSLALMDAGKEVDYSPVFRFIENLLLKEQKEERERCKRVILRRTEIPKGARNPTRDEIVVLGEQLAFLISTPEEKIAK